MEEVISDIPLFTNDAVVFGILIALLLGIFKAAESSRFSVFFKIIPALLLCYFLPSVFSTLGIISPKWIDMSAALAVLADNGYEVSGITTFKDFKNFILINEIDHELIQPFIGSSKIYFVASRYLLPASLILLTPRSRTNPFVWFNQLSSS